jgi:hypothetical protein
MKDNTKAAKELLAKCAPLAVGDRIQFDNFLTGFATPVDAHCTELEFGKYWQFALYWNSVPLGDVIVEHLPNEVIVETL